MVTIFRDFETRCERMKREREKEMLLGAAIFSRRRCAIASWLCFFNFVKFLAPLSRFASSPGLGQGSPRYSRLFRSCLTRRSILPGQFRRSKNIRLTRRPYHLRRKSITPVRRSVRWVAKMYGRHAIPSRLSFPVALMPGTSDTKLCQTPSRDRRISVTIAEREATL